MLDVLILSFQPLQVYYNHNLTFDGQMMCLLYINSIIPREMRDQCAGDARLMYDR